ncbi:MAG: FGGY-family carbohydrate kinase [Gammaproteobacteria bacterium]|nr:FGGY-family carbohydrate kinase [Gammaproteobacteria bacterium]
MDRSQAGDPPTGDTLPGHYLGIDLGTSGCRAIVINGEGQLCASAATTVPPSSRQGPRVEQRPQDWWRGLVATLTQLGHQHPLDRITALAVNGTSGSVLLCDPQGEPLGPALMYNDRRATQEAGDIAAHAPQDCGAQGVSSGLAKALWLVRHTDHAGKFCILNQADWVAGRLCGQWPMSDYNNSLKLGFDPITLSWPSWIEALGLSRQCLPTVKAPGSFMGKVSPAAARATGLTPGTAIMAGTTDSVAAFLATGAHTPGHGVTALGTTLALKLLSTEPLFAPRYGIYSHRLGDQWLVGGASNSGGAALDQYFNIEEIESLSPELHPDEDTGLSYYPLPGSGERFPVNDPHLAPYMDPPAPDRKIFLQAILEGIARIEARGYALMHTLGAPQLGGIYSTGGGSHNPAWTQIRQRMLKVPMLTPLSTEAAYGTARLAAGVISKPQANRDLS